MKVVEIINSLGSRDGAEVFFQQLCEEMNKDSHIEVKIICLWDQIDKKISEDFDASGLKLSFCHKKRKIDFKAARRLKSIINDFSPDIIHTHLSVLPTYALAFGTKKKKWKLFHTMHSVAQKETTTYGKMIAKMFLRKKLIQMVGISDKVSKTIVDTYKCKNVATIYNGVKLQDVSISNVKKYDLICVARFSQAKNHKLLFDACERLFVKCQKELSLICLGKGELFDYYSKYTANLQCSKNITFAGTVYNVYEYLSECKFFILTSTHEGNPIAILESLNCGIPVIAPNVGGIPDIISNGNEGFLFKSNSLDELVSILNNLDEIFKSKKYEDMVDNCIKKSKQYSMVTCKNNYVDLFAKTIK